MGGAAVTGPIPAPLTTSPRLQDLTTWDSDWAGLRVVVTGIGVSGFAAADTLIELGARVVVVDAATSAKALAQADTLRIVGAVDVLLGEEAVESVPKIDGQKPDLVVTSPGWRPDQALLAAAARAHIPVWGDVELAWRLRERKGRKTADWLTITGTNGKTTTVGLTESMLQAAGLKAIAVGNVGTPILDALRDPVDYDVFAVELSSFQLHWSHSVSPVASVCLNVAEDHVDWHGSYASYLADKAKVYANTQKACIYNAEQIETERMVEDADVVEGCRAVGFTTVTPAISMLGVVEGLLVDRAFIAERKDSAAELASMADLGAGGAAPHGGQRAGSRCPGPGLRRGAIGRPPGPAELPSGRPPHPARGPARGRALGQRFQGHQPARRRRLAVRVPERGVDRGRAVQGRELRLAGPGTGAAGSRPWS